MTPSLGSIATPHKNKETAFLKTPNRKEREERQRDRDRDTERDTKEETEQCVMLPNCKLVPGDP